MPELPEVETVKSVIEPQVAGRTIERVAVRRPEVIAHPDAEAFCRRLAGQVFAGMARRGKFLVFHLASGGHVLLRLRMTGCLLATPGDCPEEKHTHVVFSLAGGKELRFSDTRRFGRFWLMESGEEDTYSGAASLGMEPFDSRLTGAYLQERFGRRKKAIKECLLDQSAIAGIGNIYSDEILFLAKIRPTCPACCVTAEKWQRLAEIIPKCLNYFIEKTVYPRKNTGKPKGGTTATRRFCAFTATPGNPARIAGQRSSALSLVAGAACIARLANGRIPSADAEHAAPNGRCAQARLIVRPHFALLHNGFNRIFHPCGWILMLF